MREKGEVTVFLAMILVMIMTLLQSQPVQRGSGCISE